MSAGDRWDSTPPPADQWDAGPQGPGPQRSGANTAVAVLDFVLGGLSVIGGIIAFMGGALVAGGSGAVQRELGREFGPQASGAMGFLATLMMILAFLYLLVGAGGIAGGVGVLNRRQWGRILTLVLGGLCGLLALLNLVSVFMGNVPGLASVAIFGGFAVTVFVILLNPVNAREFS